MKVLDVNSLRTEIDSFYSQITTIQKAIQSLIILDDALKGETGEAIRAFYDECHRPLKKVAEDELVLERLGVSEDNTCILERK